MRHFLKKMKLKGRLLQGASTPRQLLAASCAMLFVLSLLAPLNGLLVSKRYDLNAPARTLLGPTAVDYASLMKLENNVYRFNPGAITSQPDPANPAVTLGREGGASESTMPGYDLHIDPKKGVTIYDSVSKLSFSLVPEFRAMLGQQVDNHVVYPLAGLNAQAVYSPKANGLKEDIIVYEEQGDALSFSYHLDLPDSLVARLTDDGNIGIYSGDPSLFGSISFGSDADRDKIELARKNADKNNLVFTIPAPIIEQTNSSIPAGTHAHFELNGTELKVVTKGLKDLQYPISIDPTVVVNSANTFADGNNEGNIEFDSANNQIKRGGLTGGSLGAWTSTTGFTTGRRTAGAVAYNGFVYVAGGENGASLSDVQYAPINSNGTLGSWSSTTSFSPARFAHSLVAYNGYMYVIGGATAPSVGTTNVQYAKINSNGTLGAWSATTVLPTARYAMGAVAANGYLYITGGYNGSSALNDVYYAAIKADGTLGSWTSQTGFSTARYAHQAAAYNNFLYIYGGSGGTSRNDIQYAPINSDGTIGSWTTNANTLSAARHSFGGGFYGGYLYAVGGETNGTLINSVEYAPVNNNGSVGPFSMTGALSTPTEGVVSVFYKGYAYALGGLLGGSGTQTFGYTGGQQTFSVPTGVTSLTAEAWGAQGGDSLYNGNHTGALGGYAKGTVSVTPGSTVYVYVGGRPDSSGGNTAGGYNGGGSGYYTSGLWTGPGGGGTDVRVGGTALANRVIIGGGGGGASSGGYDGGVGGGSSGGNATFACGGTTFGGSQSAGGTGFAGSGSLGQGGNQSGGGGGGGGGYYGGAGGGGFNGACSGTGGGGGGSGYVSGTSTTMSSGIRSGHGQVTLSYSQSTYVNGSYYAKIDGPGVLGQFKTTTAPSVATLSKPVSVSYNGYIYRLGGGSGAGGTNTCEYAAISSNGTVGAWASTNCFTAARYAHAGTVYNGYVYVTGGADPSTFNGLGDVWYAQINANGTLGAWSTTTSLPNVQWNHNVVAYNGYLYSIGGNAALNNLYAPINGNGTVGSWTSGTNVDANSSVAVVYGGRLYIMGGYQDHSTTQYATINANGSLGSFSNTSSFTTGRWQVMGGAWNGYLYILGGYNSVSTSLQDVQYAKINSDGTVGAWSSTNSLLQVRGFGSATIYNGFMYVMGDSPGTLEYAPINNGGQGTTSSWGSAGSSFTTARYAQASVATNGYLYTMGGENPVSGTQTFNYTGGTQTFTVPATITSLTLECWGAAGGNAWDASGFMSNTPALGGYAKSIVTVTPGESLTVVVGGQGSNGSSSINGAIAAGGYNGGGNGGGNNSFGYSGGGGGGASDIRQGGSALGNRVCVGGGGGGAAGWARAQGGAGGGTTGTSGQIANPQFGGSTSTGGTQSSGGSGGTSPNGPAGSGGSLGQGGTGGSSSSWEGGGGGGGGYFGGGGGAGGDSSGQNVESGGAGGSGYAIGSGSTMSNGQRVGNGQIIISYNTSGRLNDVQYAAINSNGTLGSWTTATNALWSARSGHKAVAANGYLYIVGGSDGTNKNDVWYAKQGVNGALAADAGCGAQWCSTTAFTTGRSLPVVAIENGRMYIAGGYNGGALSDVQYATINANGTIGSWSTTTALPAGRNSAAGLVYNGYLYITGGHDGTNYLNSVLYAPINSDGTVGSWQTTTNFNAPRYTHAIAAYNGYMYVYGGAASPLYNDVQYAPINANGTLGNWNHTASFSTTRAYLSSVAYNGYLYAVGGCSVSGCATNLTDTQYASLNSIARKGTYSKLIDMGAVSAPTKLKVDYSLFPAMSYKYADTATSVWGSANAVTSASNAYASADTAYTRYVWLRVVMDDSNSAVFGDTNQTTFSGFELSYRAVSTSSQQPRLRGGKTLQNGVMTGLDAQPN